MAKKYTANAFGRFDCPEPGCPHTGKNGFAGPGGLAGHRAAMHGYVAPKHEPKRRKWPRNAAGRIDCPHPGCGRVGADGFKNSTDVRNHHARYHGGPIPPTNGQLPAPAKRKYTRRQPQTDHSLATVAPSSHVSQPLVVESASSIPGANPSYMAASAGSLNYCPHCGNDLAAASMHLHREARAMGFALCPRCKVNLAVISVALGPELQAIDPDKAMVLLEVVRRVSRA